jgi:hypothetical protein
MAYIMFSHVVRVITREHLGFVSIEREREMNARQHAADLAKANEALGHRG